MRVMKDEAARERAARSRSRSRAAWRRPRARRSCGARPWSISWSARKAITACPACSSAPSAASKSVDTEFPAEDKFDFLQAPTREAMRARGVTAFVTMQEGCDKFCTFCVVPYTRGAEVSRPVAKDRRRSRAARRCRRARDHADRPERQCLSRRRAGRPRLDARAICCSGSREIPGIARLRYTTSHPRDVDDSLIAAHRDLPELMPQLHLPVQSGSDRILAAMNRRHTRADYLRAIERLARGAARDSRSPRISSSAFPGETDADFRRHADADRGGRLRGRVLVQIFAAARHARRRDGRAGARDVKIRAACRNCRR